MSKINLNTNSVSAEWLNGHLDAENLIVLNATIPKVVGNSSELSKVQIPGTQFFDIKKDFSDLEGRFPNTVPTESQFQEAAKKLGVNKDSIIVVYDDLGIYSSPRAWWLFKTFGFSNVAVLNGGLPNWITKGFPLETKRDNPRQQGNFKANYHAKNMIYIKDLEQLTHRKDVQIIDARSKDRFNSIVPEPRTGLRSGTIPSSINLPYQEVLVNSILKPKTDLEVLFNKIVSKDQRLVFSCGSGITACTLTLAADLAGYKNSAVYDGSWTEYGTLKTS